MLPALIARRGRRILLTVLLLLSAALPLRAELALANFGGTNLLKLMPVGDSITDDCATNGAWRLFLQSLLDTNGIAFTNTGRLQSSVYTGFTKRRHEGYCGSVIGPPGVFAVYNYSTIDAYLMKIVTDALAITNNRPDLMLVLIGANDIGRGRNPWSVATNDMRILLNIIFSAVPNAHVLLAKTTTLQNANLGYGAYATNVPIYNAALQTLVNQRRAQGQKVFLADMFSAVDYGTMFLSDHLHPNPLGLKAIAGEWAARIETIVQRTNKITSLLITGGASWRYSDAGQDLGTNWAQPNYDDSGWSNGVARLGYGDPATATKLGFGSEPTNKFVTAYFRRPFVVPWNAVYTNLNFRLARADGAVVWLNGQEIFRANLPGGPLAYTNLALNTMTGYTAHIFYPTNLALAGLPAGTNVLAVEVHLSSVTNSTLGFDLELIGSGYPLPTPSLAITPTGGNVALSWPLFGGDSFALYSATNLTASGSWALATPPGLTNGGQIVVTQAVDVPVRFFRLQRP
jgi:lysophospholipase L1-like esterase